MGSGGEFMIGRGWWWVVAVELWLVVCGLGWWRLNYGWPWVVVVGRGETFFICYDAFIFKTKSVWEFFLFNKVIKANLRWYLLKRGTTWNNLKRPTTSKKRPETTYSNLQRARNDLTRPETTCNEQESTWNDLQRARNDLQRARNDLEITHNNLKRPIANKKRPGNNLDLQPERNNLKRPTTSKTQPTTTGTYLLVFSPTFNCNHSSTASQRIMVKIERQTFLYYHVYLLRDIKFTGHVANHFDTCKLTFVRQKLTLWIKQKKSIF